MRCPQKFLVFQPEAEEHLQIVSDCLLSLETNHSPEEINKLFRAIHTVRLRGPSWPQASGWHRPSRRRPDWPPSRRRLDPLPQVIDLCLESVDVLKDSHKQWAGESETRAGVDSLNRIAEVAPIEADEAPATTETAANAGETDTASPRKQLRQKPQERSRSGREIRSHFTVPPRQNDGTVGGW
jgi:chemotaxis protein histidine kinase CheA